MFKKAISIILSLVILFGFNVNTFALDAKNSNNIDTLDIIIAAATYLNSNDESDACISENTYLKQIVPLHNNEGKIIAYYASFTPSGYAVINNNPNNPTVIEFGKGNNKIIEEILSNESNPYIIYNNPVNIYSVNNKSLLQSAVNSSDIYDYYPDLKESNFSLVKRHNEIKQSFLQDRFVIQGDGDYGFIDLSDMPAGDYDDDTILKAESTDWAIMDEFEDIAENHCGATAVTNLALYFANRGHSNLKINNSRLDTFKAVHKIVGNGPVMTIAGSAKEYFKNRGYTLKYSSLGDFSGIKTATTKDRPCGILLADGLFSWHWILSVGWRQYSNGGNYMRIMDGWYDTIDRYYKIHSCSLWISATEYWVEN